MNTPARKSTAAAEGLPQALRQALGSPGIQAMVARRRALRASSGKPPGDPVRAVRAIVAAVVSGPAPQHLLLGNDAFDGTMPERVRLRQDFTAGEAVARGADLPKAMP